MNRRAWLQSVGQLLIAAGLPGVLTNALPDAALAAAPAHHHRRRRRRRRRMHRRAVQKF